jgi:hypothetical protein
VLDENRFLATRDGMQADFTAAPRRHVAVAWDSRCVDVTCFG